MSRAARVTLGASALFAVVTIWGVHYMQRSEREVRFRNWTSFESLPPLC